MRLVRVFHMPRWLLMEVYEAVRPPWTTLPAMEWAYDGRKGLCDL